jgi:hypothetical protein
MAKASKIWGTVSNTPKPGSRGASNSSANKKDSHLGVFFDLYPSKPGMDYGMELLILL